MIMRSQKGFSLVELLVAISVSAIVLVGMTQAVAVAIEISERQQRSAEALNLAEEGMEAIRAMRNNSWSANIQPLANNVNYYPLVSGSNWSMSDADPGLVRGQYERTVRLAQVYRDASDNISSSGTVDPNTKLVTVAVGWRESNATTTVVLETYLTNFLNN